ncbi:hypothetical protein [Xanthobacter sp. VNH20]|uniref:hypothetical protein n=1 Tax=Xanthobacter sp. VNH20 TaxID=3156616 RepID=UPI0032B483DF
MARPRKTGRRLKSGRLAEDPRPVRAKSVTDVATSQPHRRWLPDDVRLDQRAESALGRLYLARLITQPQCWAGERLRGLLREFHLVLASPVTVSTAAIMVAEGVERPAEAEYLAAERPETEEERRERVLAQFEAVKRCIGRLESARAVTAELDALVMRDLVPAALGNIEAGLTALADLWGYRDDDPGMVRVKSFAKAGNTVKPGWPYEVSTVIFVEPET